MAVTGTDIVTQALRKAGIIGIGNDAADADTNDAFTDLNEMLAQWQVQRWLVYHLVDKSIVSTGAQSYTIGPGGDIAYAVRPERLEAAFLRQPPQAGGQPVDYPLILITDRESYSAIALKSLVSFTRWCFYDSGYPLGRIYFWPIPNATIYELHVVVKEALPQLATLATAVTLPLEYFAAIKYNLARRLRAAYTMPPNEEINKLAQDGLNIIRAGNTQVPALKMPRRLVSGTKYNIYGDYIY